MKKFICGTILGLFLYPLMIDLLFIPYNLSKNEIVDDIYFAASIIPSYGITKGVAKGCTKETVRNGFGYTFKNRDFNNCGKINIFISDLIYGESENGKN